MNRVVLDGAAGPDPQSGRSRTGPGMEPGGSPPRGAARGLEATCRVLLPITICLAVALVMLGSAHARLATRVDRLQNGLVRSLDQDVKFIESLEGHLGKMLDRVARIEANVKAMSVELADPGAGLPAERPAIILRPQNRKRL